MSQILVDNIREHTLGAGVLVTHPLTLGGSLSVGDKLTLALAVARIIGGTVSLSLRNNADTFDNILISDIGAITVREAISGITILTLAGPLIFINAVSKIVPGPTSLSLRNNADTADNVLVTDAGQMTTRSDVNLAAGVLKMASTQVVTTRRTGYTNAMTGTANRATAYDTATITLVQLAERMKAIEDDLILHGLLGA